MPARQRGFARKRGKKWLACWYDEQGRERTRGGYTTKGDALDYANEKADETVSRVAAARFGDVAGLSGHRPQSVDALCDTFLEKHGARVDEATKRKLNAQLRKARAAFGDRHPDSLAQLELEDWQGDLPEGSRYDVFRAFRQTLTWGKARKLIETNASDGIANPKRPKEKRKPILPFQNWEEVDRLAAELHPRYAVIPIFAAGTGMRPEEWIALERADLDLANRRVLVCKRFSDGQFKKGTKTVSERWVPLRQRVLDALATMPPRIDTPLLFPAPRGGYIDLERFRYREWAPALRAAGLAPRGPNACRHSFATWGIAAGVPTAELAVKMGTSTREIEDTYFRWLKDSDDRLRAAFDAFDARAVG